MAGIHPLERGAQHPHRPALGLQAAAVGGRIDALRQATHHRPARLRECLSEGTGHGLSMAGGAPGAHHRHRLPHPEARPQPALPLPKQLQGRPFQLVQCLRQARIPQQQAPLPLQLPPLLGLDGIADRLWPQPLPIGLEALLFAGLQLGGSRQGMGQLWGAGAPGHGQAAEHALQPLQAAPADARAFRPDQPPQPCFFTGPALLLLLRASARDPVLRPPGGDARRRKRHPQQLSHLR